MDIRIVSLITLIAALGLFAGACGEDGDTVTGRITFDGDLAIPAGAVLTVEVRDVSLLDAPSKLMASQTIEVPRGFPIHFTVPYETNRTASTLARPTARS